MLATPGRTSTQTSPYRPAYPVWTVRTRGTKRSNGSFVPSAIWGRSVGAMKEARKHGWQSSVYAMPTSRTRLGVSISSGHHCARPGECSLTGRDTCFMQRDACVGRHRRLEAVRSVMTATSYPYTVPLPVDNRSSPVSVLIFGDCGNSKVAPRFQCDFFLVVLGLDRQKVDILARHVTQPRCTTSYHIVPVGYIASCMARPDQGDCST